MNDLEFEPVWRAIGNKNPDDGKFYPVAVDSSGRTHTLNWGYGEVSVDNSTDEPIVGGGVFTGKAIDILYCGIIFINIYSDVGSATDGLVIQQSSDGTNWDHDDVYTYTAGTAKNYSINPYARYMRIVYTNGELDQTEFRLQTICKANSKPSSHRIQDSIIDDDDAELVKSVLSAKASGDGFVNIEATASNNLRVTDAESGLAIASGDVVGTTFTHKFGYAPDFDQTDGVVTIWDGANDAGINQMRYQYSTTADIDSVSSSSASDTFSLQVTGLDSSYEQVTQTVVLQGQTRVALSTPLIRIYRMKNSNSSNNVGRIFCYVNTAISGGVPSDSTKVRAIIGVGNNQTLMAVYTIPANKTGYMRRFYTSIAGANKSSNYRVELRIRAFGEVFALKNINAISDNGTSYLSHPYVEPEVITEKSDIELRVSATATGVTAAAISGGFDIVLKDN